MQGSTLKRVQTSTLEIAYYEHGPATGWPVVLYHGFPYSVNAYDDVAPKLAQAGARVIVPYVRGFGQTRFLSPSTKRYGQQAALAQDALDLLDALGIDKAVLGGFDWGGVTACTSAALWPDRVVGLVSYAGYDVVDRAGQKGPFDPSLECTMWYQHLFQHERGRSCLEKDRRALCRLLWQQWSPTWKFSEEVYQRSAEAFDNPDFVDVVICMYRHVFGTVEGDPELEHLETKLAAQPTITVPTVTLDGTKDPLKLGGSISHAAKFVGKHERRVFEVGHSFPMEAPDAFAEAIVDVHRWQSAT